MPTIRLLLALAGFPRGRLAVSIALGVQYIGLMDDLAIFDRALDAAEIKTLFDAPRGVAGL